MLLGYARRDDSLLNVALQKHKDGHSLFRRGDAAKAGMIHLKCSAGEDDRKPASALEIDLSFDEVGTQIGRKAARVSRELSMGSSMRGHPSAMVAEKWILGIALTCRCIFDRRGHLCGQHLFGIESTVAEKFFHNIRGDPSEIACSKQSERARLFAIWNAKDSRAKNRNRVSIESVRIREQLPCAYYSESYGGQENEGNTSNPMHVRISAMLLTIRTFFRETDYFRVSRLIRLRRPFDLNSAALHVTSADSQADQSDLPLLFGSCSDYAA